MATQRRAGAARLRWLGCSVLLKRVSCHRAGLRPPPPTQLVHRRVSTCTPLAGHDTESSPVEGDREHPARSYRMSSPGIASCHDCIVGILAMLMPHKGERADAGCGQAAFHRVFHSPSTQPTWSTSRGDHFVDLFIRAALSFFSLI